MKKEFKTINFQLFGNGDGAGASTIDIEGLEDKETYTKEELMLFAQKYADARVTSAIAKRAKKEGNPQIKKSFEQMTEEERREAEFEAMKKEIASLRRDNVMRDNKLALQAEMSKRNIPVELSDFIVSEDSDTMFDNLKLFENTLKNIVNSEVTKRLKTNIPNSGNTSTAAGVITKEAFKKMSLYEQNKLYEENPELYTKLVE